MRIHSTRFTRRGIATALISVAIFGGTFASFASWARESDVFHEPPAGGDARDYEAIAFNLWKGRGFGYYWSDPEWQAAYLQSPWGADAIEGRESGYYATTYRPPAFPMLWAATYVVAGRDFGTMRLVNCALMAGAVAFGAAIAVHFGGLLAAPLAAYVLWRHPQIAGYSDELLTEPLATFLISLFAWLWLRQSRQEVSLWRAAQSGAVLGLIILARSIFVLWLPVTLLMPARRGGGRNIWLARAICALACLVVVAPWWTRNIVVTGAFMPTGSQGPINLPAGFSQQALDNEGRWRSNRGDGAEELVAAGVDPFSTEYEVKLAAYRADLTLRWMREHPHDVARLMYLHVWQELRPRDGITFRDWLLPAAALALVFFWRRPGVLAIALLLAAMLFSIAMTWGATGRFVAPVQPLVVALACALPIAIAGQVFRLPDWLQPTGVARA